MFFSPVSDFSHCGHAGPSAARQWLAGWKLRQEKKRSHRESKEIRERSQCHRDYICSGSVSHSPGRHRDPMLGPYSYSHAREKEPCGESQHTDTHGTWPRKPITTKDTRWSSRFNRMFAVCSYYPAHMLLEREILRGEKNCKEKKTHFVTKKTPLRILRIFFSFWWWKHWLRKYTTTETHFFGFFFPSDRPCNHYIHEST